MQSMQRYSPKNQCQVFIPRNALQASWEVGYSGAELPDGIPDVATVSLTPPPNSASNGNGNQHGERSELYEQFFNVERGSISRSTVRCSVYSVIVHKDASTLVFDSNFENMLKVGILMAHQFIIDLILFNDREDMGAGQFIS